MSDPVALALIAAAAGIVGAVAGGSFGVWLGHRPGAAQSRKDRLRALYADVLKVAVRRSPRELGYRASADTEAPSAEEIDSLVARLMVEGPDDGDRVRRAFWYVVNRSDIFLDDKGNAEGNELAKSRQAVVDSLNELQRLVHERVK